MRSRWRAASNGRAPVAGPRLTAGGYPRDTDARRRVGLWLLILALSPFGFAACGDDDAAAPAPIPSATAERTRTFTPAAPPTATATPSSPPTRTRTATATPTDTFLHGPTPTDTPPPSPSASGTPNRTPTFTFRHGQPSPTSTQPHGPTATKTPEGPTPTATETPTPAESTPTATPTIEGAPALHASILGADVRLSWDELPSGREARIVRRLNAPPSGPDDPESTFVFAGAGTAAVDRVGDLFPDVELIAGQPAPRREYLYTLYACEPGGGCEASGITTALRPTLVEVLAAGGYVLHWRHSAANVCNDRLDLGTAASTSVPDWWRSCEANCGIATTRQLNDTGRQEATLIGDALRQRDIPIGRVLSSEYCRNFTTAELMAFGPTIELRQEISYFVYDEAARCQSSHALIGEVPAAGSNTAIVGHAGFPGACATLGELAWSEAAIFKPDGSGGSLLVARVPVDAWAGLP